MGYSSFEKKPQGSKVLDTMKSEVFIHACAVRHGFHVRQTVGAVKVTLKRCHSREMQESAFLLPFDSLCTRVLVCSQHFAQVHNTWWVLGDVRIKG